MGTLTMTLRKMESAAGCGILRARMVVALGSHSHISSLGSGKASVYPWKECPEMALWFHEIHSTGKQQSISIKKTL